MIVIILSILFAPLTLLFFHWKWNREDERLGLLGPKCLPLIGNLHQIWKANKNNNSKFS